jgi:hypothetical protein
VGLPIREEMEKGPGGGTSMGTWGKGCAYPATEREGDKREEKGRSKMGLKGKGYVARRQLKTQL